MIEHTIDHNEEYFLIFRIPVHEFSVPFDCYVGGEKKACYPAWKGDPWRSKVDVVWSGDAFHKFWALSDLIGEKPTRLLRYEMEEIATQMALRGEL